MKTTYIFLTLFGAFLISACTETKEPIPLKTYTRFQSVPASQTILLQKGHHKESCVICGMDLPTFYKTNHASISKENMVRQYCSLHCVVHDNEINRTDLYDLKVVDVTTLKFIPAQSAFYVVGSNREATMSNFSKYAFAKRKDADLFVKEYGGYVMNFYDAYTIAMQDFIQD